MTEHKIKLIKAYLEQRPQLVMLEETMSSIFGSPISFSNSKVKGFYLGCIQGNPYVLRVSIDESIASGYYAEILLLDPEHILSAPKEVIFKT